MASLYDLLFGCHHKNFSFPLTNRRGQRSQAASVTGTYVACLDCGKEFAYDWREMKVVDSHTPAFEPIAASHAESFARE
jgi:hypothetical protein